MRVLKAAVTITFAVLFSVACAMSDGAKDQNPTPATANVNSNPPPRATAAPGSEAKVSDTAQSASADTTKLYMSKCAMCHGSTGRGATPGTPDLTDVALQSKKTVADFADTIKSGKKPTMPAFGSQLSDEQILALAQYARTFAKK